MGVSRGKTDHISILLQRVAKRLSQAEAAVRAGKLIAEEIILPGGRSACSDEQRNHY
jgi:hypothetical protein